VRAIDGPITSALNQCTTSRCGNKPRLDISPRMTAGMPRNLYATLRVAGIGGCDRRGGEEGK
jgi:hypothetical protein